MALTASAVLLSSCGTYTGQGAFAGATFGSVLGSAIGGISGGWRGHDIGTVVGMAGGAAVGAAIGAAADQKEQEKYEAYKRTSALYRAPGEVMMSMLLMSVDFSCFSSCLAFCTFLLLI